MNDSQSQQAPYIERFLNVIEKVGNALPHPATLFALFAIATLVLSWLLSLLDLQAVHPSDSSKVFAVVNLLSAEGLRRILTEMIHNFTGFAPLGTVLVSMLGIGIAESSGFIGAALRFLVLKSPPRLLTFVIVFSGVLSNMASEVGYVLLVPLGAIIFLAAGRHPIAGMAAAFAGVSGGYSANLFLGTIDPLLAGLSTEAAQIVDKSYEVSAASNYYFMFVSTFFIAAAGTLVTEKIILPRLGVYTGDEKAEEIRALSTAEKRGLLFSVVAGVAYVALLAYSVVPADGILRNPETGEWLKSPFMQSIVAFIFLGGAVLGIAYGIGAGTFKSDSDIMKGMGKAMETLGIYMVLCFFAAQFVAYFKWTNLGVVFAIKGAEVLKSMVDFGIPVTVIIILFVLLAAASNMFMGSASAKWALLAPVFIPMLMYLGISPELTQAAYRVGDSVTNIISPMMSYFALIVAFIQRYDKNAGIGTIVATMLPYTIVFLLIWVALLSIWMQLGLDLGPGAGLNYLPAVP